MSPQQIIKSFLPGTQHLAPAIIERLRESGYAIVPVEPTREMWAAGANVVVGKTTVHHDQIISAAWPAMVAAAEAK